MIYNDLKNYHLILASQSPRRHQLLRDAGFVFDIQSLPDSDESFPGNMPAEDVPEYLAVKKASQFPGKRKKNEIVITADTVVILDNEVINKPASRNDAIVMLEKLSGRVHVVITGVCLLSENKKTCFSSRSLVYFNTLTYDEIIYYIDNYKPYDKAGAYGVQEWMGYTGIQKIDGCFFNVMGFPLQEFYKQIKKFIS